MRKTNLRKAAISALLMLIVAVVSLTGVTYAWFTSGETAEVKDIELTVDGTQGGLEIALFKEGDYAFGTSVSFDNITKTGYKPVSTTEDALRAGQLFTAALGSNDQKIKSLAVADDAYYFAQSIVINNYGGEAKEVELSGAVNALTDTKLAARVAIVIEGYTKESTFNGASDDFDVEGYTKQVFIYEPNAKQHTNAGMNEARRNGITGTALEEKYAYYGIKAAFPATDAPAEINKNIADAANADYLASVTTYDLAAGNYNAGEGAAIEIEADAIVKATIYVWVEGQDYDCHNDIAAGTIEANLMFTIKKNGNTVIPEAGEDTNE